MNERPLFKLLLLPSFLSGMVTFLISISVLGYSAWLYTTSNQLLYNYLSGPYGLQSYVLQNSLQFSAIKSILFASPISYYIVLVGVALVIGMTVFVFLQIATSIVRGSTTMVEEALDHGPGSGRIKLQLLYRLFLRILSVGGWVIYLAFFVSSLAPFTVLVLQGGIDAIQAQNYEGGVMCLAALLALMLALHLHVVFARLSLLRPRIYGGEDEVIAAEITNEHA
jgi:hypothetical protein